MRRSTKHNSLPSALNAVPDFSTDDHRTCSTREAHNLAGDTLQVSAEAACHCLAFHLVGDSAADDAVVFVSTLQPDGAGSPRLRWPWELSLPSQRSKPRPGHWQYRAACRVGTRHHHRSRYA